jgi:hypothetical protein
LTARFVVFASELDLRHHERQVHGASSSSSHNHNASSKIQLEFQIANSSHRSRRIPSSASQGIAAPEPSEFDYDLDGQAFVPAALPIRGDPDALHPLHAQRTQQLREQAAIIRAEQEQQQADAFPSLQPPTSSSSHENQQRLSMGWTSQDTMRRVGRTTQQGAGTVTDQDFPSLLLQSKTNNKKKQPPIASAKKNMPLSASWSSSPAVTTTSAATSLASTVSSAPIRKVVTPIPNTNTTANLTAENFPSLAPSSASHTASSSRYTAANDLARKINSNNKNNAPNLTSNDFPALGGAKSPPSKKSSIPSQTHPSTFDLNVSHFPPPPPPSPTSATTASVVSLEDVKGKLGPANFKKLKNYTKQFAAGELLPDSYVDRAASVFPDGYADADFWKFVPALVASSPARDRDAALRYMDNLKRMRNGALNAESMVRASTSAAVVSPGLMVPPAVRAPSNYVYQPPRTVPSTGKSKTNAWGTGGGGGPSVVMRSAKAPSTSVTAAAAAAAAAPSRSTATKFMAKEAKQEQWQQANPSSGKNKNKNKQKKELQALAFGK